jgi:hypothetical protein
MTTPVINVGGQYRLSMNVDQVLPLPAKTPFGKLSLKWSKIIGRLIRLNREIATAYGLHAQATSITGPSASGFIEELPHLLEEIAYWLRKTGDELIGLSFLCEARLRGEPLPTNIEVDCVGALLAGKHPALLTKYSVHLPHLRLLNDVSNAYKHSFINSDLNIMGRDEPVLYALTLQRNDLSKPESFVGIALGDVVCSFDAFFQDAKTYLTSWPDPHLTNR